MVVSLNPFNPNRSAQAIDGKEPALTCDIQLQGPHLHFEFVLPPEQLEVFNLMAPPPLEIGSEPTVGLWESTCFEIFMASPGLRYWEWNFSPSGQWCYFQFSDYRGGRTQPVIKAADLQLSSGKKQDSFFFKGRIPLPQKIDSFFPTAVSKTADGKIKYWAHRHPKDKPDFHLRSLFISL